MKKLKLNKIGLDREVISLINTRQLRAGNPTSSTQTDGCFPGTCHIATCCSNSIIHPRNDISSFSKENRL
ncbi:MULTISPECIES: hypothetical protein [Mucilaginibacter]|jgi:hypothetical protein|uniref:hypothetical protein n=1 Tax=Mucilaginibacter TaxID=423349 RepID=UPI001664BBDD|nr:hypothetical protein [Mucilaginibacter rubeus]